MQILKKKDAVLSFVVEAPKRLKTQSMESRVVKIGISDEPRFFSNMQRIYYPPATWAMENPRLV